MTEAGGLVGVLGDVTWNYLEREEFFPHKFIFEENLFEVGKRSFATLRMTKKKIRMTKKKIRDDE